MADFLYRASLKIIPRIFVFLSHIWFATLRVQCTGLEKRDKVAAKSPVIAVFWHYSFVYLFYHLRKFPSAVMVSASRDGEYIAQVAALMGHDPIRGSSNQSAVRALRLMLEAIKDGKNVGIVADGSQGPARVVQAGCILAASKSGNPVIPIVWAADRYIKFNSWDKTVVPYPFARISLYYGEPFYVPGKIKAVDIEKFRLQLENQMNELYDTVWKEVGRDSHDKIQNKE